MADHATSKAQANIENGAAYAEKVLTKLFTKPIPLVVPTRTFHDFCDSDGDLLNVRSWSFGPYRTEQWADPLLPFNVSVNGVESNVNTLPLVTVGSGYIGSQHSPLSEVFNLLRGGFDELLRLSSLVGYAKNDEQLDDEVAGKLFTLKFKIPILSSSIFMSDGDNNTASPETKALTNWAKKAARERYRKTGINYLLHEYGGNNTSDEGPFIRLGLLMVLLAPDVWFEHGTSVVKNMVMNGYVKKGSIKRIWSAPVEDNTETQIGSKQGSSRLYVRSITEYTRMLEGDSEVLIKCDDQSVCSSSIKFIPVKASWNDNGWLLPFILAHTTTEWWNHALQISLEVAVPNPADEEATMVIKTVPKAATVYYPGRYEHICLVVVDRDRLDSKSYSIGGFEATYDGNPNFSQYVYQALGRLPSESPGHSISIEDCFHALEIMEETMGSDITARKHPLLLGILTTSRFCGFSVWPSPTSKDHHIRGVMSFNSREPIKIGDSTARDWSDLLENPEKQQLSEAVKFFTYWRVDPMLLFSKGHARFTTYQEPLLEQVVKSNDIYKCGETCDEFRILSYACVFNRFAQRALSSASFLNSTIAYGSLMLGLMTWYTAEKGITLFYHNTFKNEHYKTYDEKQTYLESLSKLTNRFIRIAYRDDSHDDVLSIVGNHLSLEKNWHHVWYSGVIPWWFARAAAEKFGWNKWPVIKTPIYTRLPTEHFEEDDDDDDLDCFGEILAFRLDGKTCDNTELCFLAQTIAYEKGSTRFFKIATPDVAQYLVQTNWISWYYNALNDTPPNYDLNYKRLVELNTLVLPKAKTYSYYGAPKAFVSVMTPIQNETDFQIDDGLRWLQKPKDWCK